MFCFVLFCLCCFYLFLCLPFSQKQTNKQTNKQTTKQKKPFGVVLIADCAYCVQATQKLIKTAERLLVKGGKCLIAHKR